MLILAGLSKNESAFQNDKRNEKIKDHKIFKLISDPINKEALCQTWPNPSKSH